MERQADDKLLAIGLCIGERGHLTGRVAKQAARDFRALVARYPGAIICPSILGYDDDPRPLWEIPEARDHFCKWAKFARVNDAAAAMAAPLNEDALGVMAKCGALEDIDPDSVKVEAEH